MYYLICIFIAFWNSVHAQSTDRMAILSIHNTTRTESSYVEAMPDMIVSELMRMAPQTQLVERRQVEAAIQELQLDIGGLTKEDSRRLGQWVGAERILVGTLSSLERMVRLDLRIIEVESGRICQAGHATVDQNQLQQLIPQAVEALYYHSQTILLQNKPPPSHKTTPPVGKALLQIEYRAVLSLLTQKAVPMQKVRIYRNGKLIGESPVLNAVNKKFNIFMGEIPAGSMELRLEHGVVNKHGEWVRLFSTQPESRYLEAMPHEHIRINYKLKVNSSGFKFSRLNV